MSDKGTSNQGILLYVVIVIAIVIGTSLLTRDRVDRNDNNVTKIMMAVTECTPSDTAQACRQKQADRIKHDEIVQAEEVDCRFQRALKGLAPTPPTEKCVTP